MSLDPAGPALEEALVEPDPSRSWQAAQQLLNGPPLTITQMIDLSLRWRIDAQQPPADLALLLLSGCLNHNDKSLEQALDWRTLQHLVSEATGFAMTMPEPYDTTEDVGAVTCYRSLGRALTAGAVPRHGRSRDHIEVARDACVLMSGGEYIAAAQAVIVLAYLLPDRTYPLVRRFAAQVRSQLTALAEVYESRRLRWEIRLLEHAYAGEPCLN